jgi:hypothetical protein
MRPALAARRKLGTVTLEQSDRLVRVARVLAAAEGAHSVDCERPFRPIVITDSGDRERALTAG